MLKKYKEALDDARMSVQKDPKFAKVNIDIFYSILSIYYFNLLFSFGMIIFILFSRRVGVELLKLLWL